ncbi:MAG TPA: cation diffusion facilitator family transporter [Clostridia bacterium]|jgi:cation diffusion facilitator family transporter|nr:cation diffusion facilitator family transporter [Clostridia bacterium]
MAIGLAVNLALALSKLYVGLSSGSLTIIMDSVNNFIDLVFNIVAVIAFIVVSKKSSKEMPHGYGRAEYLASFLLSLFIFFSGCFFFIRSLQNIMIPVNLIFQWTYIVILIVSIIAKIAMGFLLAWANKEIKSNVFKGVILDSFVDAVITFLALLGFVLSKYLIRLDAIFGIVISLIFIGLGIKMIADNLLIVLGKDNFNEESKKVLYETLIKCPGIKEVKSLSYHDYGFGKITAVAKISTEEDSYEDIANVKKDLENKFAIELIIDIFDN